MLNLLFENELCRKPLLSLVLIDWSCRESLHVLDYLAKQTVPREQFEIIWIEYYNKRASKIEAQLKEYKTRREYPLVDKWIVMDLTKEYYYHKHIMYNLGIIAAKGKIVTIFDSDSIVAPNFVETIIKVFEKDNNIVLHMDQIRNYHKRFYPFNYPSVEDILGEGVWNYKDGTTTGLLDTKDPLHSRNYGGCMSALRSDLIKIGGADEHIDYMGHICGAYDMTFRLINTGKKEIWHKDVLLYHVYHPGTEGDANYIGPHDGKYMSTAALEAIRSGRIMPLDENPVIQKLRLGEEINASLNELLAQSIDNHKMEELKIDEAKKLTSEGRAWIVKGKSDEAVRCWEKALKYMPPNSVILNDLGWAYYHTSNFEKALQAFKECINLDPENLRARLGRGWAYYQRGLYEEAKGDFSLIVETPLGENDKDLLQEAFRGRGWSCLHLKCLDEGVQDFNQSRKNTEPDNHSVLQDILRGLGWTYNRLGRFDEAKECFTQAIEHINPTDAVLLNDALNGRQEAQQSISLKQPETPPISTQVSSNQNLDGEKIKLEQQVNIKGEILGNIGWAYYQKSNFEEAVSAFNEALALNPQHFRALIGRGWIYLHQGTLDNAFADFNKAIEYIDLSDNNNQQEAFRGRGWANYHKGNSAEAINDFNKALEFTAENDNNVTKHILRGRSWAYYSTGETEKALDDFRTANDFNGSSQLLAKTYLGLQMFGSRLKQIKRGWR